MLDGAGLGVVTALACIVLPLRRSLKKDAAKGGDGKGKAERVKRKPKTTLKARSGSTLRKKWGEGSLRGSADVDALGSDEEEEVQEGADTGDLHGGAGAVGKIDPFAMKRSALVLAGDDRGNVAVWKVQAFQHHFMVLLASPGHSLGSSVLRLLPLTTSHYPLPAVASVHRNGAVSVWRLPQFQTQRAPEAEERGRGWRADPGGPAGPDKGGSQRAEATPILDSSTHITLPADHGIECVDLLQDNTLVLGTSHGSVLRLAVPWGWGQGDAAPVPSANLLLDQQQFHRGRIVSIASLRNSLTPTPGMELWGPTEQMDAPKGKENPWDDGLTLVCGEDAFVHLLKWRRAPRPIAIAEPGTPSKPVRDYRFLALYRFAFTVGPTKVFFAFRDRFLRFNDSHSVDSWYLAANWVPCAAWHSAVTHLETPLETAVLPHGQFGLHSYRSKQLLWCGWLQPPLYSKPEGNEEDAAAIIPHASCPAALPLAMTTLDFTSHGDSRFPPLSLLLPGFPHSAIALFSRYRVLRGNPQRTFVRFTVNDKLPKWLRSNRVEEKPLLYHPTPPTIDGGDHAASGGLEEKYEPSEKKRTAEEVTATAASLPSSVFDMPQEAKPSRPDPVKTSEPHQPRAVLLTPAKGRPLTPMEEEAAAFPPESPQKAADRQPTDPNRGFAVASQPVNLEKRTPKPLKSRQAEKPTSPLKYSNSAASLRPASATTLPPSSPMLHKVNSKTSMTPSRASDDRDAEVAATRLHVVTKTPSKPLALLSDAYELVEESTGAATPKPKDGVKDLTGPEGTKPQAPEFTFEGGPEEWTRPDSQAERKALELAARLAKEEALLSPSAKSRRSRGSSRSASKPSEAEQEEKYGVRLTDRVVGVPPLVPPSSARTSQSRTSSKRQTASQQVALEQSQSTVMEVTGATTGGPKPGTNTEGMAIEGDAAGASLSSIDSPASHHGSLDEYLAGQAPAAPGTHQSSSHDASAEHEGSSHFSPLATTGRRGLDTGRATSKSAAASARVDTAAAEAGADEYEVQDQPQHTGEVYPWSPEASQVASVANSPRGVEEALHGDDEFIVTGVDLMESAHPGAKQRGASGPVAKWKKPKKQTKEASKEKPKKSKGLAILAPKQQEKLLGIKQPPPPRPLDHHSPRKYVDSALPLGTSASGAAVGVPLGFYDGEHQRSKAQAAFKAQQEAILAAIRREEANQRMARQRQARDAGYSNHRSALPMAPIEGDFEGPVMLLQTAKPKQEREVESDDDDTKSYFSETPSWADEADLIENQQAMDAQGAGTTTAAAAAASGSDERGMSRPASVLQAAEEQFSINDATPYTPVWSAMDSKQLLLEMAVAVKDSVVRIKALNAGLLGTNRFPRPIDFYPESFSDPDEADRSSQRRSDFQAWYCEGAARDEYLRKEIIVAGYDRSCVEGFFAALTAKGQHFVVSLIGENADTLEGLKAKGLLTGEYMWPLSLVFLISGLMSCLAEQMRTLSLPRIPRKGYGLLPLSA